MRFLESAKKLRKVPFSLAAVILIDKLWKKLTNLLLNLKILQGSTYISNWALQRSTISKGDTNQWFDTIPEYFIGSQEQKRIVSLMEKYFPGNVECSLNKADNICNHIFNLLGSGDVFIGEKIDWHKDFKSGHVWDRKFYKKIREINLEDDSDIKVPWELSRFQHAVCLGKAFWFTGNEKYVREFVSQFEDWYEKNPPMYGVNWSSTMDVAIRAINLIWAIHFFRHSKKITDKFKNKFLKSMLSHGRFIMANLEYDKRVIGNKYLPINGNHYLSNLVGLIYLGVMFPFFKESKKWLEKGMTELFKEIDFQVYEDGVSYELSISYHRLILEMSISALLLLKKVGLQIPGSTMMKLEKMIEFIAFYTKPDGKCPVIKDADNGRLHILDDTVDINDHRYLLCIGAILFGRSDFKATSGKFWEEAVWLLEPESLEKFNLIPTERCFPKSKPFIDSGFYALRSDDCYMFVTCSDVGMKGFGGHSHNDCLSFELYAGDRTFIVDPGSYIYSASPEWRNLFRSTAFHNTARVDGEDINRIQEDRLFYLENRAIPQLNAWESNCEIDYLDIQHSGYARLEDPVTHKRRIIFDKIDKFWIITDILYGKGDHRVEIYYHFDSKVKIFRDGAFFLTKNGGTNIALLALDDGNENWEWSIEDSWVSRSYGIKDRGQVLVSRKAGCLPVHLSILIYPFSGEDRGRDLGESIVRKARFHISRHSND